MKKALNFLKNTLLSGALIVLPVWLATFLILKALAQVRVFLKPVSSQLPESVNYPEIIAAIALVAVCFLVGWAIRTVMGRRTKRILERKVFERIPGYTILRNVGEQMVDMEHEHGFQPALAEMENGLAPCFIVEELPNNRRTVFIPSAPTPAAGTILILDSFRVHPVDAPVSSALKCVTRWGTGAGALFEQMRQESFPEKEMETESPRNRLKTPQIRHT